MSEHEGFCMPLIESMYLGLPVLAFDCTAIPGTLAGAGILFHDKNYPALAELVDWLLDQPALLERVIAQQRRRAAAFLPPTVKRQFVGHLRHAGLLQG
jgi:glycosyltransferase involved in cell wall biosynthesis